MPSMHIGGAERSLLGLLDAFDYDSFDVSLFLYRKEGEFLQYVNKNVYIIPQIEEYETFDVPIKSLIFSEKTKFGLLRLKSKIDQRIHARKTGEDGIWMHMQKISKNLQRKLPNIPGEYDLGIMFLGVPDTLVNKVNAKVKLAWNHTDYTTLGPDTEYDRKVYNKIDYIVSVSKECRNQFLKVYPQLHNKAIVIENILSKDLIFRLADEPIDDARYVNSKGIRILSIGRYSYAKNFDNVPIICRKIIESGVPIKWYIIGYGGDEELIKNAIKENGMEDNVILLGKKVNPYPYIKACDVYIQPSRFEGKSVTVREAQTLGKPVIITNYATAGSQIENLKDGAIVPMETEACAKAIALYLTDRQLLSSLADNCQKADYTNKEAYNILVELLGK